MLRAIPFLLALPLLWASPVAAQEIYGGVYDHEVDTFLSHPINEHGVDVQLGYRFRAPKALKIIGSPSPYVFGSFNLQRNTDFIAAGLSWKIGKGPVFVRPGLGVALHDCPHCGLALTELVRTPANHTRENLGSTVLFEPEIALGMRLSSRWDAEASWVHLSHAHFFSDINPGLDVMGVRLTYHLH